MCHYKYLGWWGCGHKDKSAPQLDDGQQTCSKFDKLRERHFGNCRDMTYHCIASTSTTLEPEEDDINATTGELTVHGRYCPECQAVYGGHPSMDTINSNFLHLKNDLIDLEISEKDQNRVKGMWLAAKARARENKYRRGPANQYYTIMLSAWRECEEEANRLVDKKKKETRDTPVKNVVFAEWAEEWGEGQYLLRSSLKKTKD